MDKKFALNVVLHGLNFPYGCRLLIILVHISTLQGRKMGDEWSAIETRAAAKRKP